MTSGPWNREFVAPLADPALTALVEKYEDIPQRQNGCIYSMIFEMWKASA
jgi:hypothetical protein